MKKCYVLAAILFFMTIGAGLNRAQTPSQKSVVVRLDPALDEIVSPDAELHAVTSGFGFTEGLTWVQKGKTGYLLFTDIPANVVNKMTPDGTVSVFVKESGYHGPWNGYALNAGHLQNNGKNPKDPLYREFIMIGADGLTLDPQGRLLIATFPGRSVDRIEKNGKRVVLADRFEGKRLNGPNDLVVKKDGAIFFTDTFSSRLRDKDPTTELNYAAIYMIKDGKISLAIKDIPSPNGLAFSPDEKYLYANVTGANLIRRYDVQPDDTMTTGRLLFDLSVDKSAPGGPDGMRVDSKGNIYSSGPGGVWIISPEGKHLGTILMPEGFANFSFGDADYKTFYIGGRTTIYKIRLNVSGNHY
jgi:gluconolactonase